MYNKLNNQKAFFVFIITLIVITVLTSCSTAIEEDPKEQIALRVKSVNTGIIVPAYVTRDVLSIYKVGDTVWIHKGEVRNTIMEVTWDKTYQPNDFERVVIENKRVRIR